MTDELFLEIMRWAFVVFVWTSVAALVLIVISYAIWVIEKAIYGIGSFVDLKKHREQMLDNVAILWGEYQYRLNKRRERNRERFAKKGDGK